MAEKHYFFDFDETLVDTSKLMPYRQTNEGRDFVAEYPNEVKTYLIGKRLRTLVNRLAKSNQISIATNSPRHYTKALLQKHGFSKNIPIYSNLHKPCHEDLKTEIPAQCRSENNALFVGDSASDILAAHGCSIPSAGVTWGKTSTDIQLRKSEPSKIVSNIDDLVETFDAFENDNFSYKPRTEPDQYIFLPKDLHSNLKDPDIKIHKLVPYYPIGHHNFSNSWSNEILRFKEMKKFSWKNISDKIFASYFYNGELKCGRVYFDVFLEFYNKIIKEIASIPLSGNSFVIAAPNSAPEFCYKTDINQIMAILINLKIFNVEKDYLQRYIFRVFPKKESHLNGDRNEEVHYNTIGMKDPNFLPEDLDNLFIFDDITTTNSQLISIATLVRELCKFNGNIYGLVLGQTTY